MFVKNISHGQAAKGPVLFLIDTGAFSNLIELDLARAVGKVGVSDATRIKGLSGEG